METTVKREPLLVDFANHVAKWFPELDGRALAVSEAQIDRENIPTLPLAMISLEREVGNHKVATRRIDPVESFVLEFWFEPERYKKRDGSESPFWGFYNYETIRNRLLHHLLRYKSPVGERVQYVNLTVESSEFAVALTFRLQHSYEFCDEYDEAFEFEEDRLPLNTRLQFTLVPATAPECPQDCLGEEQECNKCL